MNVFNLNFCSVTEFQTIHQTQYSLLLEFFMEETERIERNKKQLLTKKLSFNSNDSNICYEILNKALCYSGKSLDLWAGLVAQQ